MPTFSLAIFTTDIIQNDKAVKKYIDKIFSYIFSAKELGFSKKDPQAYRMITKQLKTTPSSILFIDDTENNIKAASQAGLNTLHFTSNESLLKNLKKIINQ